MAITIDKQVIFEDACSTAEEFTKLFYECMDKKRNLLSKLYMDTGVLVWNGNAVSGNILIQQFLEKLPVSEHIIISLDAQPIHEEAIQGQKTVMIVVVGTVKLAKKPGKTFCQNFIITAQGDKWKIVSDCLRFQETLPS